MSDEKDQDRSSEVESDGLGADLFSSAELPDADDGAPPPGLFDSDDDPGLGGFEDQSTRVFDASALANDPSFNAFDDPTPSEDEDAATRVFDASALANDPSFNAFDDPPPSPDEDAATRVFDASALADDPSFNAFDAPAPSEDAETRVFDASALSADLPPPADLPPEETPVMPPEAHAEASESPPPPPPVAFEDEETRPSDGLDDIAGDVAEDSDEPPPDAGTPSNDTDPEDDSGGDDRDEATESPAAASSSALPAHLQLPAIDFSLPDGSDPAPSVQASASDESGVDLPAHLNLPSFPQFELPPVPGEEREEDRRVSDGVEVAGIDGGEGSFAEFDDSSAAGPPPTSSEDSANWEVSGGGAPPPMPPPRAVKKPVVEAGAPAVPEEMPALPSLPQIKVQETPKRDPTLIDRQLAEPVKSGGRGLAIFGGVIVLLVAVVGVAFVYRDTLVSTVTEPVDTNDPDYQAAQVRLKATKLWAEANTLYEKKKLKQAVAKVNESLELDPTFGRSHRLLGVLYVALKKNDSAVTHYERYLALEPDAADAAEVQKIVDDYKAAQKKKVQEKEPEPSPSPKKKKRKRR